MAPANIDLAAAFGRLEAFQGVAGLRIDEDFDAAAIERMSDADVVLSRPVTAEVLAFVHTILAMHMPKEWRHRFANAERYLTALQERQRVIWSEALPAFKRAQILTIALAQHLEFGGQAGDATCVRLLGELQAIENRFAV